MIRWASADVAADSLSGDGDVDVRVQVQEGPLRLISGRVGYASSSGITAQGDWSHRNFRGDARVLTFAAEARTGVYAADETFEKRYGISMTVRQPYLGSRHLSGLVTPFLEYRDGAIDRSRTNGVDGALIYELGSLRSVSLQYRISAREVFDYRFGSLTDVGTDFLTLQTILDDSLGAVTRESRLTASSTLGRVDDWTSPRSGLVTRLTAQVAGPGVLSTVEFGKISGSVTGFRPMGDLTGRLRVFAGRLFPFGKSVPTGLDDTEALLRFLEFRDAAFTAGGTGDVRGWGDGLLGPKVPDSRLVDLGDSIAVRAERYIPIGGLARLGFAAELAAPLPWGLRRHSTFVFLDGARVWTPDSRYPVQSGVEEELFFFGTGVGLEFATAIGPVRVAVGYKLNPSPFDLRPPEQVRRALEMGDPVTTVPEDRIRRFPAPYRPGPGVLIRPGSDPT